LKSQNMFKLLKSHMRAVFMTHAEKHINKFILRIYTMTVLVHF
jgi:hypothetical protein